MGLLGFHLLSEKLFLLKARLSDAFYPLFQLLPFNRLFRGRIKDGLFHLLHGPLALQIKSPDGVHLIIPQLDPKRQFLGQGKHVDDPAPYGKLPHAVYLSHPLIPKLHQPALPFLHIYGLPGLYRKDLLFHGFQRKQMVHQSIQSGDHHTLMIFYQML